MYQLHQFSKRLSSYSIVFIFLFILFSFQNCYFDSSSKSSSHISIGSISAYLSGEDESVNRDKFHTNSDVVLTFKNFHPHSQKFQWIVNRGFESIIENQISDQESIQQLFTQPGTYDVLAISHSETDGFLQPLTRANKRIIIGDQCEAEDILEITLIKGLLTAGRSATFGLKDTINFSNIHWKVTLPSKNVIEKEDTSVEIDLSEEKAGLVIVEVSAADPSKSECLTYRKKEFAIHNTLTPYFHSVDIVDDNDSKITVTLENNNIYKYKKTSDTRFVLMDIRNANKCTLKAPLDTNESETTLPCHAGKVDITVDADTQCSETVITVKADYIPPTNNRDSLIHDLGINTTKHNSSVEVDPRTPSSHNQKSYYNYCSQDVCYFGDLDDRPNYHTCEPVIPPTSQKHVKSVPISSSLAPSPKVDIAIYWDTSGTMRDNVSTVTDAIDDFLSSLSNSHDTRIGVFVGHGALGPGIDDLEEWTGRLVSDPEAQEPYVLDSQTMSVSQMKSYMEQKLEFVRSLMHSKSPFRSYNNGGEALLFSLYHSIQGDILRENQGHGFFRDDAALSVILISDENDLCSRYPGHFPNHQFENNPDKDKNEDEQARRFCQGITTDNVLAAIRNLKDQNPVIIDGIIETSDSPGYQKLINTHGAGSIYPVHTTDYKPILSNIGDSIKKKVPSQNNTIQIILDFSPIIPENTQVFLETPAGRSSIPFHYNETTNTISVERQHINVNEGGTIQVEYYTL